MRTSARARRSARVRRSAPTASCSTSAVVGADTRLVAHVTLCAGVRLGERCLLHPGVVIGADGFGHAPDQGGYVKIPQVGSVLIGDDVEIGANSTIDRGAIGDTVIERGVKIDNQVQVGHNCRIGEHTVISGCVGISGSVTIGRRCMIGGMVGIVGHLQITDDVYLTGKTMVTHSITKPGLYSGQLPFDEARRFRRNSARFQQLDELARRVRALEKGAGAAAERRTRREGHMSEAQGGFGIDEVMRRLPHRYPMLLVDRVLECVSGERLVALKNVTANEQFFSGHFPGRPVMPGVFMLEALAQAAGILCFVTARHLSRREREVLLRGHRQGALPPARRAGGPVVAEGGARAQDSHDLEVLDGGRSGGPGSLLGRNDGDAGLKPRRTKERHR